ncbi:MAG: transposase [Ruminococcaceae bacterium]|nr:transposase [Oscillospiraceae bacterium]
MKFKTELHAHTAGVSQCAKITVEETVESYIKKGVSTLVIANHYSPVTFENMESASWEEKNKYFLSEYHRALEVANGRINIILGMEFRNNYSDNDYLIYGITEEFITSNSNCNENNFLTMHLKEFSELVHKSNALVFQAHPFRNGMKIVNPQYLDGIEVINGHRRHDSRNDIASMWAEKFNLLKCGGSDSHMIGDEATTLIVTEYEIKTPEQLVEALKGEVLFDCAGE